MGRSSTKKISTRKCIEPTTTLAQNQCLLDHLHGCDSRFFSFVAVLATRPFECLFLVQRGEHAEDDRLAGFDIDFRDAVGRGLADVVCYGSPESRNFGGGVCWSDLSVGQV